MPDPERIDQILATIRQAWAKVPDWRLGQLLVNSVKPHQVCPELFSLDDDRLEYLVARLSAGKTMTRHPFDVASTFEIPNRGLVLVTNKRYEERPSWLDLKTGDDLELRSAGHAIRTRVAGLEFTDPWTPQSPFAILLPSDLREAQVPVGSEVWVTESSVLKTRKTS